MVCGSIEFKGMATDEDILLVDNYLEFGNRAEKVEIRNRKNLLNSLLVRLGKHKENTEINFTSVNWGSHIDEDKIKEMLGKLKGKLEYYAITLYHLCGDSGINFTNENEAN